MVEGMQSRVARRPIFAGPSAMASAPASKGKGKGQGGKGEGGNGKGGEVFSRPLEWAPGRSKEWRSGGAREKWELFDERRKDGRTYEAVFVNECVKGAMKKTAEEICDISVEV